MLQWKPKQGGATLTMYILGSKEEKLGYHNLI